MKKFLLVLALLILGMNEIHSQNWSSMGGGLPDFGDCVIVYNNELYAGGR